MNNRRDSNGRTATKAKPKPMGKAWADLDVVVAAEAKETTVDGTM